MLVVLTVRGLTMPGSMKGLVFYLDPVWSELAKPTTWRFAFGQVFFSLSLAFGVMITYASFLHRKSDINNNAAIIGLADFATSFIAGLAIFATLGGMAFVTAQAGNAVEVENVVDAGPGLAFVAFPYALAQLPGSAWWSFIFFFTLVTLGIDSAFSITESVLAAIVDKTGWKRCIVLPVMSLFGLGFGLIYITQGGLNWLGAIDGFVNGIWGIVFVGLLECVVLGWGYRIESLRQHANERSDWHLGKWWNYAIRIFIPIVLGTIFLWNLINDCTRFKSYEFILDKAGNWIWPDCVGLVVIAVAPVIAVAMSLMKSPLRQAQADTELQDSVPARGRIGGIFALLLGLASAAIIGIVFKQITPPATEVSLLYLSLGLGVATIILGNAVLDKHDSGGAVSWFARWAGIIGTIDVSLFLAILLNTITKTAEVTTAPEHKAAEHLSGVSYVILSMVFLLIIVGLGWCFYRAMTATAKGIPVEPQLAEDTAE